MQQTFPGHSLCTTPCWGATASTLESPPVLLESLVPPLGHLVGTGSSLGINAAWVPLSSEILEALSLSLSSFFTEGSVVMACPARLCPAPGAHHPPGAAPSPVTLFRGGG